MPIFSNRNYLGAGDRRARGRSRNLPDQRALGSSNTDIRNEAPGFYAPPAGGVVPVSGRLIRAIVALCDIAEVIRIVIAGVVIDQRIGLAQPTIMFGYRDRE